MQHRGTSGVSLLHFVAAEAKGASMGEQKSQLLPVKQAAAILGMAPTSLYRLCKSGRTPSYAVGAKGYGVRVDVDEVKAALRRPVSSDKGVVR